jgi:DNA-binding response OmpR family regulator
MTLRVLVVDDYPGTAEMTCVLVRLLGHAAQAAQNAAQALDLLDTFAPDIVVLDLGLPDASGYDVARKIRSRAGAQPFIAAMTGWTEAAHHVHTLASGIDMHVAKPASAENLARIIETAQAKRAAPGA